MYDALGVNIRNALDHLKCPTFEVRLCGGRAVFRDVVLESAVGIELELDIILVATGGQTVGDRWVRAQDEVDVGFVFTGLQVVARDTRVVIADATFFSNHVPDSVCFGAHSDHEQLASRRRHDGLKDGQRVESEL